MLKKIMIRGFEEVYTLAERKNIRLRISAYMVALDRVIKARRIRGLFP
jgi:glutamate dehydrogenase/leucine dehydrogenase